MKETHDYTKDLAEIRLMMERSSKFLSLSGWAGIFAGVYALAGTSIAHFVFDFRPDSFVYIHAHSGTVALIAVIVLVLALISAFIDSRLKAKKQNKKAWNTTSQKMLTSMAVPLSTAAILILFLIDDELIGLIAPLTLVFYGLALYNAGFYTFTEVRLMGLIQISLGLLNTAYIGHGLFFWAIGFGVLHIVYGIYMHVRYER
jgi:hypothetical protein